MEKKLMLYPKELKKSQGLIKTTAINTFNKIFRVGYMCDFNSLDDFYTNRKKVISGWRIIGTPVSYNLKLDNVTYLDTTKINEHEQDLSFMDMSRQLTFKAVRELGNNDTTNSIIDDLIKLDEDAWSDLQTLKPGNNYKIEFLNGMNQFYLKTVKNNNGNSVKKGIHTLTDLINN